MSQTGAEPAARDKACHSRGAESLLRSTASLVVALALLTLTVGYLSHRYLPEVSNAPLGDRNQIVFRDFRVTSYIPARDFLKGNNPYDTPAYLRREPVDQEFDLYLPLHLEVMSVFAMFPYRVSTYGWFAIQVALIIVFAGLLLKALPIRAPPAAMPLLAAVLLITPPGRNALTHGQITPEVAIGFLAAWHWAPRRPVVASLALVLALMKPQFGLPLLVLLAFAGRWRVAARGAALAVLLSLPAILVLAWASGGVGGFATSIGHSLHAASTASYSVAGGAGSERVDLFGVLARLSGTRPPAQLQAAVTVAVLVIVGFLLRRLAVRSMALAGITPTLVVLGALSSIFHQPYDLILLAWPLAALSVLLAAGWNRRTFWFLPTVVLTLLLIVPFGYVHRLPGTALSVSERVGSDGIIDGIAVNVGLLLAVAIAGRLSLRMRHSPLGVTLQSGG